MRLLYLTRHHLPRDNSLLLLSLCLCPFLESSVLWSFHTNSRTASHLMQPCFYLSILQCFVPESFKFHLRELAKSDVILTFRSMWKGFRAALHGQDAQDPADPADPTENSRWISNRRFYTTLWLWAVFLCNSGGSGGQGTLWGGLRASQFLEKLVKIIKHHKHTWLLFYRYHFGKPLRKGQPVAQSLGDSND